jgi:3-hydroxyisobutyrate dehydrogenase
MGTGIARQLDRAGRLAAVGETDADHARAAGLSEEVVALSPAAMASRCRFILFVVPSSVEIDGLLTGKTGLLAHIVPGTVLIDLTTSDPNETRRLSAMTKAAGGAYLDCGMSGGAMAADTGALTLMIGGDATVLDKAGLILDIIAQRRFHLGPSGSGHTMKLIHNLVCHTVFLATCEGAKMAECAGIPLDQAIDVFNAGNARSFASEVRFPNHIVNGQFDGRSRIANLAKDLGMGMDLAGRIDMKLAVSRAASALLDRAMDEGEGGLDFTRLYSNLERLMSDTGGRNGGPG